MQKKLKSILGPITPKIAKKIYKFFCINLDDYYLLPKKDITYSTDKLYTFHNADFMKDPLFKESYTLAMKVDGGQLVAKNNISWRMHVLFWAGRLASGLQGDFVDCGVNTGFCARSLMNYIDFEKLGKKYWLLDTFTGLDPRYSSEKELIGNTVRYDFQKNNYEQVKKTFSGLSVEIIKGSVPDTLPLVRTSTVCFLHIDMNSAIPEVAAIDFFWPKISKGGVVLFDDYAYDGHGAQKIALDKWAKSQDVEILSLPTGQGLLIK